MRQHAQQKNALMSYIIFVTQLLLYTTVNLHLKKKKTQGETIVIKRD